MSWLSSIISAPQERRTGAQQSQARQRAATRAKLVNNLRDAAQGLAASQAEHQRQQQQNDPQQYRASSSAQAFPGHKSQHASRIGGHTAEAEIACLALEQCLFYRIRTKDFGVVPFWAFLERVERLPLSSGTRPGPREKHLASVRNTVGAVASSVKVSTPLGKARAWIRQCLVSKCLEACVAALLEEQRLVKVFYEPAALLRCEEGSTILLRLCSALEAFDLAIDADQSGLDRQPYWPIIEAELEADRQAEASAAAAAASAASARADAVGNGSSARGSSSHVQGWDQVPSSRDGEESWFRQQQRRQQQEQPESGRGGGWAASALSEFDQLAKGDWTQLDGVLASVSSKVDQAVQSLDETINDLFGDETESSTNNNSNNEGNYDTHTDSSATSHPPSSASIGTSSPEFSASGRRVLDGGWVELRGGNPTQTSSLLNADTAGDQKPAAPLTSDFSSDRPEGVSSSSGGGRVAGATYPGSFIMGHIGGAAAAAAGRRGRQGRGRAFGVLLEELLTNPERCKKGLLDPALGVPDAIASVLEVLHGDECRYAPGLFVREASESDLLKAVKSLERKNSVPQSDAATAASYTSPAWLVSRLTGGSGEGDGGGGAGGVKGGTMGVSPYAVSAALVYFLHRLPEPLLTFQRREAFLACEAIPDLEARVRNVKLLVDDLPWAHQPLLLAIADLCRDITPPPLPSPPPLVVSSSFGKASRQHSAESVAAVGRPAQSGKDETASGDDNPGASVTGMTEGVTITDETEPDDFRLAGEVMDRGTDGDDPDGHASIDASRTSGATIRDAAEALAPAILRGPPRNGGRGGAEAMMEGGDDGDDEVNVGPDWEEELAAVSVVELILSEQERVLEDIRAEHAVRKERLVRKVKRLGQLEKMLAATVYLERSSHLAVVISIWHRLEKVEQEILDDTAGGREEALGLASSSPSFGRHARDDLARGSAAMNHIDDGGNRRPDSTSISGMSAGGTQGFGDSGKLAEGGRDSGLSEGFDALAAGSAGVGVGAAEPGVADIDGDVLALESMLMGGLEGEPWLGDDGEEEEEGLENIPLVDLDAATTRLDAPLAAAATSARADGDAEFDVDVGIASASPGVDSDSGHADKDGFGMRQREGDSSRGTAHGGHVEMTGKGEGPSQIRDDLSRPQGWSNVDIDGDMTDEPRVADVQENDGEESGGVEGGSAEVTSAAATSKAMDQIFSIEGGEVDSTVLDHTPLVDDADGSRSLPPTTRTSAERGVSTDSLAFTIEENKDDGRGNAVSAQSQQGHAESAGNVPPSPSTSASAADTATKIITPHDVDSDTRKLLGSIAETLTPHAAATQEGDGGRESGPLLVTRSELALVSLMEEAGEEQPGLLGARSCPPGDESPRPSLEDGHANSSSARRHPSLPQEGHSAFDDALTEGTTAFGSSGHVRQGTTGSGSRRIGSPGMKPSGRSPRARDVAPAGPAGSAHERHGSASSRGTSPPASADGRKPANFTGTITTSSASADMSDKMRPAVSTDDVAVSSSRRAQSRPVFSLAHERWVRCGFTAGFAGGKGGPEECIGRALRGASNVLALDSINYFLARYPRSAARAIKSCARRHGNSIGVASSGMGIGFSGGSGVIAGGAGSGDTCPFPINAGDIIRVIADLLSFSRPPNSHTGTAAGGHGDAEEEKDESDEERALRLAALPTWKLLDAPYAFQEAFACAVLVMEAAQTAGTRSQHPPRYQESLLETRRVLRACIMHEPSSIDALWAAAAAEGGVSLDPGDKSLVSPATVQSATSVEIGPSSEGDTAAAHVKHSARDSRRLGNAMSAELTRALGMSELDLRDADLAALHDRTFPFGGERFDSATAATQPSTDDRVSFRGGNGQMNGSLTWLPSSTDGGPGDHDDFAGAMVSSAWLMGGETAREGMIESIATENAGRSGPRVVEDGVFQAGLLRPSEIIAGEDARALAQNFPRTVASSDWVNLFSDARHGSSLETFISRCAGWQPTLVLVEASVVRSGETGADSIGQAKPTRRASGEHDDDGTMPGNVEGAPHHVEAGGVGGDGSDESRSGEGVDGKVTVFGGFASGSQWKNMGRAFAGDGGTFLFSFERKGVPGYADSGGARGERERKRSSSPHSRGSLRVYPWSRSDRCFMTCDVGNGLGMGGGGDAGHFGLFLEPDLRRGSTGPCRTFGNKPLTGNVDLERFTPAGKHTAPRMGGGVFEVLSLEVWGFKGAKTPEGLSRIAL